MQLKFELQSIYPVLLYKVHHSVDESSVGFNNKCNASKPWRECKYSTWWFEGFWQIVSKVIVEWPSCTKLSDLYFTLTIKKTSVENVDLDLHLDLQQYLN